MRALLLPLLLTACAPGAGPVDAGPECSPNLPPPSDPCLADQCGNELGVGQPCTEGGGECNDLATAQLCTVDFAETDLHFCTRACVVDEDCGEGARCAIDPDSPESGAGCFPTVCD
jgi:hypothetical protein